MIMEKRYSGKMGRAFGHSWVTFAVSRFKNISSPLDATNVNTDEIT